VFILPNPSDRTQVWGFYTLSPSLIPRARTTRKHQSEIPIGFVPMMLIGFMGKHEGTERGVGSTLILDAARRVYVNPDLAAWGLMLDSEGGPENSTLWEWYQRQGFTPARADPELGVMYAPLRKLIPELGKPQSR
jgi:hypothetical protein